LQVYDYAIVGAGLCGLTLGRRLQAAHQLVAVIDKGRGRGGRMSTRRWKQSELIFDHGLGGFEKSPIVEQWLDEFSLRGWLSEGDPVEILGFTNHYFAKSGMSSVGRALADDLEVYNFFKVTDLIRLPDRVFRLQSESGDLVLANHVILTMPVPQAADLLLNSDSEEIKEASKKLPTTKYEKAICLMAEVNSLGPAEGRAVLKLSEELSLLNMSVRYKQKSSVLLVASGNWAEERFEDTDELKQIAMKSALETAGVGPVMHMAVHGWRYAQLCRDNSVSGPGFYNLCGSELVYAGEAASRRGVSGALKSAADLSKEILLTPK
jgi:renalase